MSLYGLFNIGKSAIFASQTALNVISNNIANVNTPGFSRQEVILEVTSPVSVGGDYIGRGVTAAEVRRHYDKFVHLQLIDQNQNYGRSFALDKALSEIEQIFNEANNMGLSLSLQEFFNAWQDVATNPEGQSQRIVLLRKAEALVQTAQQMERNIENTLGYINDEISDIVDRINSIATNIASLNEKIRQLEAGLDSEEASYFRDERDRLLKELGELVEFNFYEDSNGSVTIMVGRQNLVTAAGANSLSAVINTEGNNDIYLQGQNITSLIEKGQLGGFLSVRDDIETNSLTGLRRLIASITKELNLLHISGYGLDGSTGNNFFNTLGLNTKDYSDGAYITSATITSFSALTLDEYDIIFTDSSTYEVYNHQRGSLVTSGTYSAGSPIDFEGLRVVIDGTPAKNDRFFISPLTKAIDNFGVAITDPDKIAAASSATTLPGDNTKALQITNLFKSDISNLDSTTFEGYYRGLVSDMGSLSKAAADSLTFDENLLHELEMKRESLSGVSLDEEAANLIRFQRAYEAGARIIKLTDELLQTVINL